MTETPADLPGIDTHPEATQAPVADTAPAVGVAPAVDAAPAVDTAPVVDSTPEVNGAPAADTASTQETPAVPEPTSEPEAATEVDPTPVAEPVVASEPEPVAAPEHVAEPEPVTAPEPVVASEPEPVAAPEHVAKPEPVVEATIVTTSAAVASPADRPTPKPRAPLPSAVRPRPGPQRPADAPATGAIPVVPVAAPVPDDSAEAKAAAAFGRVDDEGTVYVREDSAERAVGQFPGATSDEALGLYVRRYLDLQAKVAVFEARLQTTDLAIKEIDQTLGKLTEELAEPAAVGDLAGLRARLAALHTVAAERRAAVEAERAAAKEAAVESRTAIVEKAEKIAGTDPARMQWRPAGEQLRTLLDEWKTAQRSGPRIDRPTEESLWKRFSHARTTFDRERRHYFAELESRNSAAKSVKEQIVAEAEALSGSTDWGLTAGKFRDLMTRWKGAGRASRTDDDALWAKFRAAQDQFFHARDELNAAIDNEYQANLQVKEQLLTDAEAIDVSAGLAAAKSALRSIQDRWESAGKVPRGDVQRVEARLRAVETKIREADQHEWRRTNPETRARAEGAAAQLEQAIAQLEADLATAKAAGNERKIAEAQAALDARRAWLAQVQKAADDSRG